MTVPAAIPHATSPRVGVVTVAYRSDAVLDVFLRSIPAASAEEVASVVVDNAPDPVARTRELADASGASYVPMPSNPGYGGAINAGVAQLPATVEWVLVSNPDVELQPGAIDALREAGETDRRIAAVGPAVLNADGTVYPSARSVPSLRTGIGHALFANLWQANPWTRRYRQETADAVHARDAGWLSGSCLLVRRSAFDEISGFDDGYFMYFEDVDLGYRLGKLGYRNRYEPAARVTHLGAHATTTESAVMVRAHHDSARRFLRQKYAGWHLWPVRVVLSIGLSIRSAWVARRSSRRPRTG